MSMLELKTDENRDARGMLPNEELHDLCQSLNVI